MPKAKRPALPSDLLAQIAAAEQVDAETLLDLLREHERQKFVIGIRLDAARAADDESRIKTLSAALEQATRYAAYYCEQLKELGEQAPHYKFAEIEADVVVNDYLMFVKQRAQIKTQFKAAQHIESKEHMELANTAAVQMQKYVDYYRPKVDRIVKSQNGKP
ncbi:MAG: hypothetical protein H0U60_00135 [Blastocatellia bacterium]|nr:hypothetical protein [Blastocatellia bacterium]